MDREPEAGAGKAPDDAAGFLADVLHGLSQQQKSIPGKYLWDQAATELFDRICDCADYTPTGRGVVLLRQHAEQVTRLVGAQDSLVGFGSGTSHKIRILCSTRSIVRSATSPSRSPTRSSPAAREGALGWPARRLPAGSAAATSASRLGKASIRTASGLSLVRRSGTKNITPSRPPTGRAAPSARTGTRAIGR